MIDELSKSLLVMFDEGYQETDLINGDAKVLCNRRDEQMACVYLNSALIQCSVEDEVLTAAGIVSWCARRVFKLLYENDGTSIELAFLDILDLPETATECARFPTVKNLRGYLTSSFKIHFLRATNYANTHLPTASPARHTWEPFFSWKGSNFPQNVVLCGSLQ